MNFILPKSTFLIPTSASIGDDLVEFGRVDFRTDFVADEDNIALRYLCDPTEILASDWPLVLFGVSGCGKTTLALTLVSRIVESSGLRAAIFSADSFRRKFADALETDSVDEFRSSILKSSVFFVDDVQRLKKYPTAQAEMSSLLDLLGELEIPVVCTISAMEMNSKEVCPRLFSRLSSGLCLSVNQPGNAARRVLFSESAKKSHLNLSDQSLDYLATTFVVTYPKIKSFFGMFLVWLKNRQEIIPDEIELPLIIDFVSSVNGASQKNIDSIVSLVGRSFKLKVSDIKSSSRKQSVVLARGVTIFLLRTLLNMSFSNIGFVLGGRDHSTIMHGLDKIQKSLTKDLELLKNVESIKLSILENCFLDSEKGCE